MPTLYSNESSKFKKPSIIELVLYNMAALLGGVAAGYDVRVSNVSPVHPTLQPHRTAAAAALVEPPGATMFAGYGFAHNTYHGATRHVRAPLNAITGAPLSGLLDCTDTEQKPIRFTDSPSPASPPPPPAHSSSGRGTAPPSPRSAAHSPPPHCYRAPGPRTAYDECRYDYREDYRAPPLYTRRRAGSGSEGACEEFSPTRLRERYASPERADRRDEYRTPTKEKTRQSDYSLPPKSEYSSPPREYERPANLGLEMAPTKLRSSLKKYKKTSASGGSTPTNPTPPDSLTSETDGSYASARDVSGGSQSRVRFSPETMPHAMERRPSRPS